MVKARKYPRFRFAQDFYSFHGTTRQTFAKYYNRFLLSPSDEAFFPRKRGPNWKSRRTLPYIGQKVLSERFNGTNRYEIYAILKPILKQHTPKPSTIYAITRRHGVNRLTKPMQQSKRKIIKTRAGELGHLDSHHLSRDLLVDSKHRYYLVALIDTCTRLAWAEVVGDIKSLSVMFATLKSINFLNAEYGIQFEAILTDNGPEMASPRNIEGHPGCGSMNELGIEAASTATHALIGIPANVEELIRAVLRPRPPRTLNEDVCWRGPPSSRWYQKEIGRTAAISAPPTTPSSPTPVPPRTALRPHPFNPSNSVNELSQTFTIPRLREESRTCALTLPCPARPPLLPLPRTIGNATVRHCR